MDITVTTRSVIPTVKRKDCTLPYRSVKSEITLAVVDNSTLIVLIDGLSGAGGYVEIHGETPRFNAVVSHSNIQSTNCNGYTSRF